MTNTPMVPQDPTPAPADKSAAPVAAPVTPVPAAPAATAPADVMAQLAPLAAKMNSQLQQASDSAQPTPPTPPGPHARLAAMVQGLAIGLSSFGTSMATHGKEGGAPEVQEFYANQQKQKIEAQQAALAQKNAETQQQLMAAGITEKQMQNIMLLHTIPNDMTDSDTKAKAGQLGVIGQTQDVRTKALQDLTLTGDMDAYNKTLAQIGAVSGATPVGTAPATGAPAGTAAISGAPAVTIPPVVIAQWKNATDSASSAYPNDPAIKQYAAVLADSKSDPKAMAAAANAAKNRMGALDAGAESRTKQEAANTNAPFGAKADALNAAMLQRYQVLNPTAKALPSGLLMSADSTPKDFDRVDKILQQTETAQATKANRDIVNGMRQQTLALSGLGAPGGNTKLSGDAYLQSLSAPEQALVKEIGTGKAAPTRLDMLLARNPKLSAEVALAYSDWDSSKAASYPAVYKEYTSGDTSKQLVNGATALNHMAELQKLNTDYSRVPGTAAHQKYESKANQVAQELADFYGNNTIPGVASYKSTLMATFNRDAAIQTQAQSMGDRLDNLETKWKNAAPSAAYEAEMPGINAKAKADRATLDPAYAARQQGGGSPAAPATKTVVINPVTKQAQTIGHKVGDPITQNGRSYTVTAVDSTGKVTGANPAGAQ